MVSQNLSRLGVHRASQYGNIMVGTKRDQLFHNVLYSGQNGFD
jgi:hypothetical protein